MAQRRMMECKKLGCYNLTRSKHGYCQEHEREYLDKVNAQKKAWKIKNNYKRPRSSNIEQFYSSKLWQQLRESVKARDNFLCVECLKEDRITIATQVHHKIPILRDWEKRFDEDNLISLCHKHHLQAHGHKVSFDEVEGS